MQAVLMVAGKSTRTYPLTLTRPKPLLPIANRPLIMYSLDQMVGLIDEVILIVGYRSEMIKEALGESYCGIKLIYQQQKEQLGTGHAVLQARPHIKGRFIALNGDDLFAQVDLQKLQEHSFAALAKEVENPSSYGVYQVDENDRLLNLIEKPKEFVGNLANIGCYIFEPEIFDVLEKVTMSERGEIEITDAIMQIARHRAFQVIPISGFWLPTGYAWDLLKHQTFLLSQMLESKIEAEIEPGVTLKGPVAVGKNSIVKTGTYIEGPVVIGEESTVGPNCYIRSYSSIGHRCRVGQGVEIKNSIISDNSNICHLSYVGDSVIGENCNLGAGTITANVRHDGRTVRSLIKGNLAETGLMKFGTVFGDGVHTGIHTSINPGRKLWPGVSTRPGQVVENDIMREVDDMNSLD